MAYPGGVEGAAGPTGSTIFHFATALTHRPAVLVLRSNCPTDRTLTAVGRLQAMEQRLDAMLRAVQAVEPALEKFYACDEQKERFNRLSPTQG